MRFQRSGKLKQMKNTVESKSVEIDRLKLLNKSLKNAVLSKKQCKRLVEYIHVASYNYMYQD